MDVQADLVLSVNKIGLSVVFFCYCFKCCFFLLFFIDVAMCDSVHGV